PPRPDSPLTPEPDLPSPIAYYLHFEVEDTGHGIAPGELGNLFNAFFQTDTGRKSQQGSGLGLAISRQFVQLMGGEIMVQSHLGQGSRFYFYIPVVMSEATAAPDPSAPYRDPLTQLTPITLAADQPRYRVLVVDDHWESRKLLVKLLTDLGFEVREAINGEAAIERWQHWHPHLIWMDVRMPDMSGYEVTQRIRHQEQRQLVRYPDSANPPPDRSSAASSLYTTAWQEHHAVLPAPHHPPRAPHRTKIIALTASAFSDEQNQALAAGCDDLLRKPFNRAAVLAKLSQHLGVQFREADRSPAPEGAPAPSPAALPTTATATSAIERLRTMPIAWIESLQQAAQQVNAKKITKLIESIPPEQTALAQALMEMVDNFRFDQIIDLTDTIQPYGKSSH
ncbi:ATP-binding response regulator, partial [Trichothermofontia sp.]